MHIYLQWHNNVTTIPIKTRTFTNSPLNSFFDKFRPQLKYFIPINIAQTNDTFQATLIHFFSPRVLLRSSFMRQFSYKTYRSALQA